MDGASPWHFVFWLFARRSLAFGLAFGVTMVGGGVFASEREVDFVEFEGLMQQYCLQCHDSLEARGDLDLETKGAERALRRDGDLLENMVWSIEEREMPPTNADQPLTDESREMMLAWLEGALFDLQNSRPNDPGRVVMPRLNHHQYQRVITDLAGREIQTDHVYPKSGGGSSGFPNDGESLTAAASEAEKFLLAAKYVTSHARITPGHGIAWVDTAKTKAIDNQAIAGEIVDTYGANLQKAYFGMIQQQKAPEVRDFVTPLVEAVGMHTGAYLEAAWVYRHRDQLGLAGASIEEVAEGYDAPLPVPIFRKWITLLEGEDEVGLYLQRIRDQWRALPAPGGKSSEEIREACRGMEKELELYAHQDEWKNNKSWSDFEVTRQLARPELKQLEEALEKRAVYTVQLSRQKLNDSGNGRFQLVISPAGDGNDDDVVEVRSVKGGPGRGKLSPMQTEVFEGHGPGEPFVVEAPAVLEGQFPAGIDFLEFEVAMDETRGAKGTVQVGVHEHGEVPSDIQELPGRMILAFRDSERGRILRRAADMAESAAVGKQWNIGKFEIPSNSGDLPDRIAPEPRADLPSPVYSPRLLTPEEVIAGLPTSQRAEFDELERRLADVLTDHPLAMQRQRGRELIREFAARAWRGHGTEEDLEPLFAMFEEHLAAGDSFDTSVKLPLTAVLVHPKFLYQTQDSRLTHESYELDDLELASRLSFVLWGSLPDQELLELAASGRLRDPDTLRHEAARMLQDSKGARLAEDFAGYWLGYEGFDQHGAVDKERFEMFDDALRDAMYEEVVLFIDGMLRGGHPVTDAIQGEYSYLNDRLARHYNVAGVEGSEFRKVKFDADSPRGGLLGMGAFLTKTSKPLRTSPVLRGDWVLEEVLGVRIPAPPDNVPLLSDDDTNAKGLTLLEQLRVHRDNPACSGCHARMDPLGVAMENFDPVGQWRENDSAGNPVISSAELPDGRMLEGVPGLRAYLRERQDEFVAHLVEKFAAYALGRAVRPTDQELLDRMFANLKAADYRFPAMLETLVTSEQFRMRRDALRDNQNLAQNAAP